MKALKLIWSYDEYECETCGHSYDEGLQAYLNGELIYHDPPAAYCTNEQRDTGDHLIKLLEQLGYNVEEEHEYS